MNSHQTIKNVISPYTVASVSGTDLVHPEEAPKQERSALTDKQIKQLLKQGFTVGLAKSLAANCNIFPVRFWVVDNSSSMRARDGHQFTVTGNHNNIHSSTCTRWQEIRDCVGYHANMAALLGAPTSFRLLNPPGKGLAQEFSIAQHGGDPSTDAASAKLIMDKVLPHGATPLTRHIHLIRDGVRALAPSLEREGQKAVIVLATDGLPTNEHGRTSDSSRKEFLRALRSLEGLPVWIVIRLCTDDDSVVGYYNDLDEQLELSLEVLDDFVAEAHEVYEHNRWLNYALPLHRIREMGFHDRVFDLIDERTLTKGEVRQLCVLLFGEEKFDGVSDPSVDWMGFLDHLEGLVVNEGPMWNPIKKRVMPWIDTKALDRMYGDSGCGPAGPTCTIL